MSTGHLAPLQLAVHIVIVQLPQIIGEPLVSDCQQTEEGGFASPLTTALCPRCEIDSVLPESGEYPLTKDFLRRMYDYWF